MSAQSAQSDQSVHSALQAIASGGSVPTLPQEQINGVAKDPNAPASVPDEDTIRKTVIHWRQLYDEMVAYTNGGRYGLVVEREDLINRVHSVANNLQFLPMEAVVALEPMLQQQRTRINTIDRQLNQLDMAMEPTKDDIKTELVALFEKDLLLPQLQALNWPTLEACRDLDLPLPIIKLVTNPNSSSMAEAPDTGDQKDAIIQELREAIQQLQQAILNPKPKKATKTDPAEKTDEKITSDTYQERRRRTRIPTFAKGNATESQQWIARYEALAEYLGFTPSERVEELQAVLDGQALAWYTGLSPGVKKDWAALKTKFLHQYGGGSSPAMAAIDELKKFRQDKMSIGEFAPRLVDIMTRAQIYSPDLQLDYFKDRIQQELRDAVVIGRAKTLDEAIEISTEYERDLWKRRATSSSTPLQWMTGGTGGYGGSSSGSKSSAEVGDGQQNYQQQSYTSGKKKTKSRCFHCKKTGHLKKDCWKRKADSNNGNSNNNQETTSTDAADEEIDVFQQFLQNQQTGNANQQRFYQEVSLGKRKQQVLIDTGSTISSITSSAASRLNLETYRCEGQSVRYGNNSIQETSTKAVMDVTLEDGTTSQARLLVMDQQNEEVILGMDWLIREDLWLHPRDNKITRMVYTNSMEMASSILQEFPGLTRESQQQTITNAPYRHRIDTGNANPVATPDYRRSHTENLAIKAEVKVMLKKKVIVPSNSDWCSPAVLIKKPDGSLRFCVDYRRLNQVTIKDKYPLPRINELLDQLQGSTIFSTIDLKSGYWQLPMEPQDAKKTAFVADGSLYEFTCLPFGVVNGPASFMRFMHGVLRGLDHTMVYLDDVIVFSKTWEQHKENLRLVLRRLDDYNLKISRNKCQFFCKEVKFLGFLVSGDGIRSDPIKTQAIKDWPKPTSSKDVQQFMGLCAFYHKFMENLSTKAKPLYALLKADKMFEWTSQAQQAFDGLKKQLIQLPTLAYPDPQQPYDLHTDASNYGLGAVLVQQGRPISYASRTLQPSELNYHTTEKECLAIVWALNHFYCYLYGATFTIYTDHAALKSILSTKMPRGRIARWILTLQSYRFTIVHKKGTLNKDADALSRIKQNNQEADNSPISDFKEKQDLDPFIKAQKKEVKLPMVWQNGLLCYKKEDDTIVLVLPRSLIFDTIQKYHDGPSGGHFGVEKTLGKVKEVAWWPTMNEDIKEYVKGCQNCQRYKIRTDSTVPPMQPILPRYTGDIWASDFASMPTSKKGNRYILVFMEYLSKWVIAVALPVQNTDIVAQVLMYEIVLKMGVPSRLITDNGSNYVSEAMKMICTRLGIKRSLTSVEHPQSDGLVERANRTIKISLAAFTGLQGKEEWDEYLPFVAFAYNTAVQASTGYSPFELLYGKKATLPLVDGLQLEPRTHESETWKAYLDTYLPTIQGKAISNIQKAQARQKRYYDKTKVVENKYKTGDLVARKNLDKMAFPKERWTGPWIVIEQTNPRGTAFSIRKSNESNRTTTANVRHLRPWIKPTTPSTFDKH